MLCVIFLYSNKNIMIKNILPLLFLTCIFYSCKQEINNKNSFTVTKVTDSVYSIISPNLGLPTPENKGWNSNSHFIITKRGVLLFDSGSSETIGFKIKKAIQKVTNLPVLWIVNSHSHADHWLGNSAFNKAKIITSKHALSTMKKYGKEDVKFYHKVSKGTIGETTLKYPTELISEDTKTSFGSTEVEFIFSPNAHSEGDLLMWLPHQKVVLGGDVLSSTWMPIITNPKHIKDLIITLNMVDKLQPEHVLTGHGNNASKSVLKRDINFLVSIQEQIKEAHINKKSIPEAIQIVTESLKPVYQSMYKNFDSEIIRYITMLYKVK